MRVSPGDYALVPRNVAPVNYARITADRTGFAQRGIDIRPLQPPIWAILACVIIAGASTTRADAKEAPGIARPSAPASDILPANVTPLCLDRSNIPADEMHWLYMPSRASELATSEDFAFLSGQLIQTGAVNASDCPLGGLLPDGYATGCGLAKTRSASLYLQNVYDDAILAAGRESGVPPVMLKRLIRFESQFWPVRWGPYHYGLGHLTSMGATSALLWNANLYQNMLFQTPNGADMSQSLLSLMDASCPTCTYRIDIAKAQSSIPYIAQVLLAYCRQTTQIVFNATKVSARDVVDYPTIWKLTLLNYNAGPMCAFDAVKSNFALGSKLSWNGIADNMTLNMCIRGVAYSDSITSP